MKFVIAFILFLFCSISIDWIFASRNDDELYNNIFTEFFPLYSTWSNLEIDDRLRNIESFLRSSTNQVFDYSNNELESNRRYRNNQSDFEVLAYRVHSLYTRIRQHIYSLPEDRKREHILRIQRALRQLQTALTLMPSSIIQSQSASWHMALTGGIQRINRILSTELNNTTNRIQAERRQRAQAQERRRQEQYPESGDAFFVVMPGRSSPTHIARHLDTESSQNQLTGRTERRRSRSSQSGSNS